MAGPVSERTQHEEAPPVTSDPGEFCRRYAPGTPYDRSLRELYRILHACSPTAELDARVETLVRLGHWVRTPTRLPAQGSGAPRVVELTQHARLRFLARVLREIPEWRAAVAGTIHSVLAETQSLHLFAEVGVPNTRGFYAETTDRLSRRLLPRANDPDDLAPILARALPSRADMAWVADLPPDLVFELATAVGLEAWAPLKTGADDAMRLLSTRVSSLGLSEELRARSRKVALPESPFFQMPRVVDELLAGTGGAEAVRKRMAECRIDLAIVLEHLEKSGVSVDVVYRLEVIGACLDRIEALLGIYDGGPRDEAVTKIFALLVRAGVKDHSIRDLLRSNMRLLARKIVERAGVTGEHYITATRKDYWRMLRSAAGGGFLTVFTAFFKFLVSMAHYPPFVEGTLAGLNYAGSFILMQLCHFTLATKQPSMTAAALAHAVKESEGKPDKAPLVTMIARITRTQLCAAVGNVTCVLVGALGFDAIYRLVAGHAFLPADKAHKVLASMHPTTSGTIWFAALTGVILWMSSVAAGWVENWAVYRRLPEAIAQHPMGMLVGRERMKRAANFFANNISGFGGNIALGFMLAMTPIFGAFFGLPLDVRHVTLSMGSVALSVSSLGPSTLTHPAVLAALGGVGVCFVLNLSVSFLLALTVAMRARDVPLRERWHLLKALVGRVFRRPTEFVFPPKS